VASGFVTSPTNGQLFSGNTNEIQINVSGTYTGTAPDLSIQVLGDPTDLTSWMTIGAAAVESQSFATTIEPLNNDIWPAGGVLRLQVIDGNGLALPYEVNNNQANTNTTILVGNPGENPTDWQFLTQKPTGTVEETQLYYQLIGAPATLADFQTEFGFDENNNGNGLVAKYFNQNDLGVAEEMHCTGTDTNGVACFVRNFGSFGGDQNTDIRDLEENGNVNSIFAMVFTPPITNPNSVQFMVYNSDGNLATSAQIDQTGDNTSVPQACINCHGGQSAYDAGTHTATGAMFLQFDPLAMVFDENNSNLSFSSQQTVLAQMDQFAAEAAPTATETQILQGEWTQQQTFNPTFVPGAWNTNSHDANLYTQVIAPFCRSCHASFQDDTNGLAFATPADLMTNATGVANEICGSGPNGMPVAEQSSTRFFASASNNNVFNTSTTLSSARALLLEYTGASGACAQGQPE
jgi:hypothetical protein